MKNDFSEGKIWKIILSQAIPLTIAQMVSLLYNVVDRIYIGRLSDGLALTGVGLAFPLTTFITAFTVLFGNGGAPLFAIARGAKEDREAEEIEGQVVSLLVTSSLLLLIFCYLFRRPILYLFGASDASYVYANQYLQIYLLGTVFVVFSTGMNPFINAQGFPRIGMGTIMIGAIINIILDPIFIFALHLGVRGAAIATVISQAVSAVWVLKFFLGPKNSYPIRRKNLNPLGRHLKDIVSLGMANFIMQGTNCMVQIVCNKMLSIYGGDLYVGVMTVLNSVREVLFLPGSGISSGAQPVLGFNYGAKKYSRVRQSIRFVAVLGFAYMAVVWILVLLFPRPVMGIFTNSREMLDAGENAIKTYFFGFFFMAFQFSGQSTFQALKCPKRAIFFSLFRKVLMVVPLTILLPAMGLGVTGIFVAEPISNAIGGLASFFTMYFTLYRRLPRQDE